MIKVKDWEIIYNACLHYIYSLGYSVYVDIDQNGNKWFMLKDKIVEKHKPSSVSDDVAFTSLMRIWHQVHDERILPWAKEQVVYTVLDNATLRPENYTLFQEIHPIMPKKECDEKIYTAIEESKKNLSKLRGSRWYTDED